MRTAFFACAFAAASAGLVFACSSRDPGVAVHVQRGGGWSSGGGGGGQGAGADGGGTPQGPGGDDGDAASQGLDAAPGSDGAPAKDAGHGDAGHSDGGDGGSADAGDGGTQTLLAHCAASVNALRAQYGLSPYTRAADLEAYAAKATASDAQSNVLDGYFSNGNGGGVSSAEDEFAGGQYDPGGPPAEVLDEGIQYEQQGYYSGTANLLSQQFTQVGCGAAIDGNGNAWVAIEYR
jgi:hypothetical protein